MQETKGMLLYQDF